jgi:hypothetical protein
MYQGPAVFHFRTSSSTTSDNICHIKSVGVGADCLVLGQIHPPFLLKPMSIIKPITTAKNPINTNKPLGVSKPHPVSKHTPPIITSIQATPFSIFN